MTGPAGGERAAIRRRMRAARRSVDPDSGARAAQQVAVRIAALGLPDPGTRVAAYLPLDSELDSGPVIDLARRRGCLVYAPVISSYARRRMNFGLIAGGPRAVHRNRWGIREPRCDQRTNGRWFSLVVVPCVAFDASGGRLGMGAGFYDRHFSFLLRRSSWHRPRLLGIAYELQRVPSLPQRSWDVPLWGIVTECGVYGRAAQGLPPAPPEEAR